VVTAFMSSCLRHVVLLIKPAIYTFFTLQPPPDPSSLPTDEIGASSVPYGTTLYTYILEVNLFSI
jgi:hypothetical protein